MVSSLSPPGRSLLDYSLVICFSLIPLLLGILIFDPFNEISIDSTSRSHPSSLVAWDNAAAGDGSNTILGHQQEIDAAAVTSNSELIEVEKQIHDAKAILSEKQDEVEKIVDKVEDEIKDDTSGKVVDGNNNKVETAEEKQHEEEIKEKVIEAVVEKELGLDNWCANCKFRGMPFTCANRVDWMMNKYKITYDVAKESTMEYCTKGGGQARRRLLRRDKSL